MRIACGLFLTFLLIIIFVFSYKKNHNLFSPLCIFSLLQFLKYVPHIISCDEENWVSLNDNNILLLFTMETIYCVFVLIGYYCCSTKAKNKKNVFNCDYDVSYFWIIALFVVGLSSRLYLIIKNGGIFGIINNVGEVYANTIGLNGYLNAIANLMIISLVLIVNKINFCKNQNKSNSKNYFLLIFLSVLGMGSYILFSSRSPALELLMYVIFAFHYLVKKIKIRDFFKPKLLAILILAFLIIVILPEFRDASKGYSHTDSSGFLNKIFDEFSNVGRDTFVYEYFNSNNYWFGRNFLNIFVGWIPSSIFVNKPPVDDGMYLSNLILGYNVSPNQSANSLNFQSSIPFSTPGCLYANFGLIGIIIGGIFMGIVYKKIYSRIVNNNNAFNVVFYVLIVYQLELSTLSISQVLIPLFVIAFIYLLVPKTKNRDVKNLRYEKNFT